MCPVKSDATQITNNPQDQPECVYIYTCHSLQVSDKKNVKLGETDKFTLKIQQYFFGFIKPSI